MIAADYYDKAAYLTVMGAQSKAKVALTTRQHAVFVESIAAAMRLIRNKERALFRETIQGTIALCKEQGLDQAVQVLQIILDMEPTV